MGLISQKTVKPQFRRRLLKAASKAGTALFSLATAVAYGGERVKFSTADVLESETLYADRNISFYNGFYLNSEYAIPKI